MLFTSHSVYNKSFVSCTLRIQERLTLFNPLLRNFLNQIPNFTLHKFSLPQTPGCEQGSAKLFATS